MKLFGTFVLFCVISVAYAEWMVKNNYGMSEREQDKVIKIVEEGIQKGGSKAAVAKHIRNALNDELDSKDQAWGCFYDGNGDWGVAFKYTKMISLIMKEVRDTCNADSIYCVLSI